MNRVVRPFEIELQGSLKLSYKALLELSYKAPELYGSLKLSCKAFLKLSYKVPQLYGSMKLSYYMAPELYVSLAT